MVEKQIDEMEYKTIDDVTKYIEVYSYRISSERYWILMINMVLHQYEQDLKIISLWNRDDTLYHKFDNFMDVDYERCKTWGVGSLWKQSIKYAHETETDM